MCSHVRSEELHLLVLFIYLFVIACFRSLLFGANDFANLQELDFQDFE
jgi:hypothetical protein